MDYRSLLLATARPPVNPTDAALSGPLFTPLLGVPMQRSLDLCVAWALYGTLMRKTFWPRPETSRPNSETAGIQWPKRAHPGALTEAGQARAPWLTSWARPTFEQGCLSVLPHLEGSRKALSLPGEHLFQASRIPPNRMRPIIFHAFGRAKSDASVLLKKLAQQGWETLPKSLVCHTTLPRGQAMHGNPLEDVSSQAALLG